MYIFVLYDSHQQNQEIDHTILDLETLEKGKVIVGQDEVAEDGEMERGRKEKE